MNVLVLAPQPYYIDRGTPIDVDLLLRALSDRGESVDVVVYHDGQDRRYPNVRIHRIRDSRWLQDMGPGFSIRKLCADVLLFMLALRLMRRRRYDVIHAGEESVFFAIFFAVLFRVPYIYDMDSSIAQQLVEKVWILRPFAPLFNALEALAIRRSIAAAPVCHALADLARRGGAPYVETLHDVSQLERPDRLPTGMLKTRYGIDGVIIMYVGNLEPYQGVDLLLESFAIARQRSVDAHLVIAGGARADIDRYAARAAGLCIDDRTHFLGPWPVDELDVLLAEADILTAPRMRGINTPMKIFPYLHTGKPLLVTDLPTHTQILNDSLAMLAPADPEGFADAIERLVERPDLRTSLGAAGRAFVERDHTYEAHARRVNRLYDYVASVCGIGQPAHCMT